jgi:hypothetical protein
MRLSGCGCGCGCVRTSQALDLGRVLRRRCALRGSGTFALLWFALFRAHSALAFRLAFRLAFVASLLLSSFAFRLCFLALPQRHTRTQTAAPTFLLSLRRFGESPSSSSSAFAVWPFSSKCKRAYVRASRCVAQCGTGKEASDDVLDEVLLVFERVGLNFQRRGNFRANFSHSELLKRLLGPHTHAGLPRHCPFGEPPARQS